MTLLLYNGNGCKQRIKSFVKAVYRTLLLHSVDKSNIYEKPTALLFGEHVGAEVALVCE